MIAILCEEGDDIKNIEIPSEPSHKKENREENTSKLDVTKKGIV